MVKSKKYICECELIEKEWLNSTYYKLRFNSPEISALARPGQFVNIRLTNTLDPLLRRPMSIYRCNPDQEWIEVLIKIVGKGTRYFAHTKPGDLFDILGPLGNSFDYQNRDSVILIGGGIGIAPLIFLAQELKNQEVEPVAIFGFQSVDEVCCLSEINPFVRKLYITTDDGSYGNRGLVSEQLISLLEENSKLRTSTVFACGPNPMMAALEQICNRYGMKAQFSLEAHMACGFGVCVGCAVPSFDRKKFYLVCDDGPVFNIGDVALEP